jgi:hypothetical protein
MTYNIPTCPTCLRGVKRNDRSLSCTTCESILHFKCLPAYQINDFKYAKVTDNSWSCPICLRELFPLYDIEENDFIIHFFNNHDLRDAERLAEVLFDPYELSEVGGVLEDIDPDDNYLNVLASQTIHKCKYYLPNALRNTLENSKLPINFSIMHLNIRSTKKNFRGLQLLLHNLNHSFDCIAITESWLKPHNASLFDLEGYVHEYITRDNKGGGGISVYI